MQIKQIKCVIAYLNHKMIKFKNIDDAKKLKILSDLEDMIGKLKMNYWRHLQRNDLIYHAEDDFPREFGDRKE